MQNKEIYSQRHGTWAQLKGYTLPVFHQKSQVYVSFTAFDPALGEMRMKKIMLSRIKGKRAQKQHADRLISEITAKLLKGWNPWIEATSPSEYTSWDIVTARYKEYLFKLNREGGLRDESLTSYSSRLNVLERWLRDSKQNLYLAYQFDTVIVGRFLDYVFIDRNNTIRTRNSYLIWLKNFCRWLMERKYIATDPSAHFSLMKRRDNTKNRDVIPDDVMKKIHDYLEQHNRHFLLACYFCHYCLVRPHEMSKIKLGDISIAKQSLSLHCNNTKNHQDAVITLPEKVIKLMIDLGVFCGHTDDEYLFSNGCAPGRTYRSEKQFRDYWLKYLRRDLKLSERYKFYSLKDTGITNMLRQSMDILSVRDQARHSSILITDTYTPKDIKQANKLLLKYDGIL